MIDRVCTNRIVACFVGVICVLGCGGEDAGPGVPPGIATQPPLTGGMQLGGNEPPSAVPMTTGGLPDVQPPPSAGDPGTEGPPPEVGIPCDVAPVLSTHCALCHGATPKFSAPMPLMTLADFQAMAPVTNTLPVNQVAGARVNDADVARRMPPPGTVDPLAADELATLTAWLDSGAPGSAPGCPVVEPTDSAVGSPDGMGIPPPTSGVTLEPYEGWDTDVECYEFRASDGSKTAPYEVGAAVDRYMGFTFMPPWEGKRWVRAFRTLVDNAQVLHHWLFYDQGEPVVDGGVVPQYGAHPGAILMYGWAPGGDDMYYAPDVGPEMSGDSGYLMEIHYNSSDPAAVDRSGVEICVTATEPEHPVIRAWLGTDAIAGTSATGTCEPASNERIHIIAGTPHMHLKGQHMKVVVNRVDGTEEVVHDADFTFENQRDYAEDIWLEPGDTVTTTCTFNSPATFGTGTNQEMCYWFAQHYPAGALADNGVVGTALHGANACLGF